MHRTARRSRKLLAPLLLVLGCGGQGGKASGSTSADPVAAGGTNTSSTASQVGSGGTSGGSEADGGATAGGTAGVSTSNGSDSTASASTSSGGAGLPEREEVDCSTLPCADDELCVPWEDGCDSTTGRCLQRTSCTAVTLAGDTSACGHSLCLWASGRPNGDLAKFRDGRVCGCDGSIYENVCDALAAGTQQADPSNCDTPEGTFVCDRVYCEIGSQVCQRTTATQACGSGPLTSSHCVAMPDECSEDPSCECLQQVLDTGDNVLGGCTSTAGTGLLIQQSCQGTPGALAADCSYGAHYCGG